MKKIIKIVLFMFVLVAGANVTNAQNVIWETTGNVIPGTYGEVAYINHATISAYDQIPNGTTFGGIRYSTLEWDTDSSNTNEYTFKVYNLDDGNGTVTNCVSNTGTLSSFGLTYGVPSSNHTILFTGTDCTMQDNTERWQVRLYQGNTNTQQQNGSLLRIDRSDAGNYGKFAVLDDYTPVVGPVQEDIWLTYPSNGGSVQSPVVIAGQYNNNGDYDQLGVDLYYNNEQDQLVNEFVWYSIPQEEGNNVSFSYPINTIPDHTYQIVLSLNENGGSSYYESDYYTFDTYDLIAPDVYEDATITCSSNLDFYCYGKKLLSWAFLPSQETLNSFASLTLRDKAPISYIYEIQELFSSMFTSEDGQEFEMTISTDIGDLTLINQSMIDSIPFMPLLRSLFLAIIYMLGAYTIYRKALKVF